MALKQSLPKETTTRSPTFTDYLPFKFIKIISCPITIEKMNDYIVTAQINNKSQIDFFEIKSNHVTYFHQDLPLWLAFALFSQTLRNFKPDITVLEPDR